MQCLYRCRPACQTCSTLKKNKKLKTDQTDESVQQTEDVRKVAILQEGKQGTQALMMRWYQKQAGHKHQETGNRKGKTKQQGNTKPLKNQTKCKLNQTCGTQKWNNGNNWTRNSNMTTVFICCHQAALTIITEDCSWEQDMKVIKTNLWSLYHPIPE